MWLHNTGATLDWLHNNMIDSTQYTITTTRTVGFLCGSFKLHLQLATMWLPVAIHSTG